MKILLLEPITPREKIWGSFARERGYVPSIGMLYLYTYLKDNNCDVLYIDTQFDDYNSFDYLGALLQEHRFELIGIPVYTSTANFSFSTAQYCKEKLPESKIVFGNVHANALPERTMQECPAADYIILGEGEFTLLKLIRYLNQPEAHSLEEIEGLVYRHSPEGLKKTPLAPPIADLSQLPANIYKYIDIEKYIPHPGNYKRLPSIPIITQRGCAYHCSFCSARLIHGRKTRFLPVKDVIHQISYLVKEKGVREIYFQDSTFSLNKKFTVELLQAIIDAKLGIVWACSTRVDCIDEEIIRLMKESGCWQIAFGIETGNAETLIHLNKGGKITLELARKIIPMIKKANINVTCSYILGLPNEDEEMVINTIRFAKELCTPQAKFFLPVPYPGTKLFEVCKTTGGLRENASWDDYLAIDFDNPVYVNPKIGVEKMKYFYAFAWRHYYFSPKIWLENIKQLKSVDDFRRYARGTKALLYFFVNIFEKLFIYFRKSRHVKTCTE